jgi:hypothetical protein
LQAEGAMVHTARITTAVTDTVIELSGAGFGHHNPQISRHLTFFFCGYNNNPRSLDDRNVTANKLLPAFTNKHFENLQEMS